MSFDMTLAEIEQWVKDAGPEGLARELPRVYYALKEAYAKDNKRFDARRFSALVKGYSFYRPLTLSIGLFCSDNNLFAATRKTYGICMDTWNTKYLPQINESVAKCGRASPQERRQ